MALNVVIPLHVVPVADTIAGAVVPPPPLTPKELPSVAAAEPLAAA